MKVEVFKTYRMKDVKKKIKIKYDKTSKKRPAWIWVDGLPKDVVFINTKINGKRVHYKVYLAPRIPLFLPIYYTKDEMRKFYDKWSEIYDKEVEPKNIPAAKLLLKNLKLYKDAKILDLGAGTGLAMVPFAQAGYKNITLLDYSAGMLAKAKKRKELKKCRFARQDIRKLNLKDKYDLIVSLFSFASDTYFDEEEMPRLWRKVAKHLKPKGILALLGYDYEPPKAPFKKIKTGRYDITGKKDYYNLYVSRKK